MTTRVDIGYQKIKWTGTWFASTTSGPYSVTSTDLKSGGSVANYSYKLRHALDATGHYNRDIVDTGLVRGSCTHTISNPNQGFQRQTQTATGVMLTNPKPSPPVSLPVDTVSTQAKMAFLKKVRKAQRSFQGGVFLGELAEAIHMVTRPASSLRNAVNRYAAAQRRTVRVAADKTLYLPGKKPSRSPSARREVSKAMAGTWLEHSYGWRPLFSDVDGAMKALSRLPRIIGETTSGFARDTSHTAPTTHDEPSTGNAGISWQEVSESLAQVRYKGLVAYENNSPDLSWQSNWGLTLDNFLPTAWELIPYSFLVDYFTNVGDIIDLCSMGEVTLRWGYKSTVLSSSQKIVGSRWKNYGYPANWQFTPGSIVLHAPKFTRYSFARGQVTSLSAGITDFQMKVPGVSDWRKWANIGALALQKVL